MALQSSSADPILCAVLDAAALGAKPFDAALALFQAGVDWIQLRDRSLEPHALLQLTRLLVEARNRARSAERVPRVIVNRRIDVALSAGADGVHLGFDGLDPAVAVSLLQEDALIGVSLHSVEEVATLAENAQGGHPFYAHLAPIWDPRSKPASRPALGLDLLSRASRLGPRILAQGGLDPARAVQAIRAGASGIAVTGILGNVGNIENAATAARQLRAALDRQIQPGDQILAGRDPVQP